MATCSPEFRSALVAARRRARRAALDEYQGFGSEMSQARAALAALEGANDPLPQTDAQARLMLEERAAKRARARRHTAWAIAQDVEF